MPINRPDLKKLNVAELHNHRQQLVEHAQEIDGQLSDKNRADPEGRRLAGEKYWAWRKKAAAAKRILQVEIGRVNGELRSQAEGDSDERDHRRLCEVLMAVEIGLEAFDLESGELAAKVAACDRVAALLIENLENLGEN